MIFSNSSGRRPIKGTSETSTGLAANLRDLRKGETLTVTIQDGDNAGSIYSTAARLYGKGNYSVEKVEAPRKNSLERYTVTNSVNTY